VSAQIQAIEYYLPRNLVTNQDLAAEYPDWSVDKIQSKTGILERHIAGPDECSSDLAFCAAQKLFASTEYTPRDIDYLLLCTQSPDYFLPTTACVLQHRLGLPTSAGALDFNLGCSGYIYGLGLAHGLIATCQASTVLFITAETYSKFIHPKDRSVRTLFGDAAAATIVHRSANGDNLGSAFVFGTDGQGAQNLIVPAGGMRQRSDDGTGVAVADVNGNWRSPDNLYMNGAEIFNFTMKTVPDLVNDVLARTSKAIDDVDLFVFHQANEYMLQHLRKKLRIPEDNFYVWLGTCGNTVSSTIPIALKHALIEGRLKVGDLVMLVGFGVGYSWGVTLIRWPSLDYY
jgi:3-oxoacyl-[acyl-carrier-protein] synthase-3